MRFVVYDFMMYLGVRLKRICSAVCALCMFWRKAAASHEFEVDACCFRREASTWISYTALSFLLSYLALHFLVSAISYRRFFSMMVKASSIPSKTTGILTPVYNYVALAWGIFYDFAEVVLFSTTEMLLNFSATVANFLAKLLTYHSIVRNFFLGV
jgi:hypothetical protein